jgi:hypothetical protein
MTTSSIKSKIDGKTYYKDTKNNEIYYYNNLFYPAGIVLLILIVLNIYDSFKDFGRTVKGYSEGNVAKVMGFTKGNFIRGVLSGLLFITFLILLFLSKSVVKNVPNDVVF